MLLILSGVVSINPGPNTSLLTGSLINIRSTKNKSVAFVDFINNKFNVTVVTGTCLRSDDNDSFIASVTPPGYKCIHIPRPDGRSSGVGFFISDDIDFKVHLNHVSRSLRAYLFTCPWAEPRTLFFTRCIGLLMFRKSISIRILVPLLRVLLYHVVEI